MRATTGDRVYGPYEQEGSFRVVVSRTTGEGRSRKTTTRSRKFRTQIEADKYADSFRGLTTGVTVKQAVDAYVQDQIDGGLKFGTYKRAEFHLKKLLQLAQSGGRSVSWTARRGQELYDAARAASAVDTHRNALNAGKSWGAFCVKKKWLRANPFADVDGVGRRRKGKPQLRVDEARKLTDFLLAYCTPRVRSEAVAVLSCLLLGPRASEVTMREVRDLDDGGRLLWIPDSKTESGKRMLEVPELLQPLLRELARERIGKAPLFVDSEGEQPTRHWIGYWCKRLCSLAGVPEICPQGFRGTHGSLARRGGASGRIVQEQLGHASLSMTEGGAYVQREAISAANNEAVAARISGKKSGKSR